MNNLEKRLAAELFELASDSFANHGCNDFKRPEWFPVAEWDAMHKRYHDWNGDPQDHHPDEYGDDWMLMGWMGKLLSDEAGR